MGFREYHHLDTSVYIEAVDRELQGDYGLKNNYISKLGRTFQTGISIVVLGEILKVLIRKISLKSTRDEFIISLIDFIIKQKIQIFSLTDAHIDLFFKLRGIENRADVPELLALAIDIEDKANVFMTYDKKLLESSSKFKEKFGIKVRNPSSI